MADNIRKAKIWLETAKSLIDTAINKAQFNKKKKAVIQSLNDDGTANILMNNELFEHVEIRAGLLPEIGEVVRIEMPNGDTKDMYVDTAKKVVTGSSETSHSHSNLSLLESITQTLVDSWNSAVSHISDAIRHITSDERNLWNTVSNKLDSSEVTTTATANKLLRLDSNAKLPASITGNADGNAATATKLQTTRTISLSGDVTGSANFDGSSNVTINATVVDDSHNHVISNIDNLQSILDAKASVSHTHTSSEITDFNEVTQDAIGAILTDTSTIDFTYDDTNNQIKADVKPNSSNQKVAVSKNSTTPTGTRKQINFKDGTNISVTVADNATNDAVDVTITNTYTHPTGDGNLHVPATGTTNNGKVLKAGATAGSLSWGTLSKSDVGLGNVDNTADSAKSVLSATKLTTPRTISLTGDVTGSVSFDGSANVSITTTVADDSHNHVISNVDGLQAALDAKETPAGAQSKADAALASAKTYADNKVASVVNSAPEALDTLYELAEALGNDPNFATTVMTEIGTRETPEGAQAKVDTHANLTNNPHSVTKSQVGLGSVSNYGIATQAEAEAGTSGSKYMTPLRTKQAINALQAVKSVAGKTGAVTLSKADVGLGNVENKSSATIRGEITSSNVTTALGYTPVKKYATDIGNGSATAITVNHGLNTMDVTVLVRENVSPYSQVITDVQIVDTNKIKLLFATAPSSGQYRVVVTG